MWVSPELEVTPAAREIADLLFPSAVAGPYIDAHRRLAGESEPDWLSQHLNRALVGRRKLV